MDPSSYVCAVLLVYLCQLQGSSAVTPVFVQKGNDVLLNVTKDDVLQDVFTVVWNFNKKVVLVRFLPGREPTVSTAYTGRVEFSVNDYSLKVKNLQEADSGVYTARVTRDKEEYTEYNVTVQDAVSPVELKVDSVSRSSDSCNLTVTCSTQDSHISSTFRCDTKTCSQEGGEQSEVTTSGASLHVYLANHSIICNHSNQVNWTKDIERAEHLCVQHADAVSPVELKVDSVSNSSDSCNLTVTCSTQDSHISSTFRCDTKTCSQDGGEQSEVTTSGASLHVYLENHSIICNHSNQVNWTKDIKMTEHFCPQHADSEQLRNIIVFVIVPVAVFTIIIFCIVAVFYHRKRRKRPGRRENTENTIYAFTEMETVAQPPNQTNDASDPSTVYSMVGSHTGPTETRVNPPESLYAQIERSARS